MIGYGVVALRNEESGELLGRLARAAVDDAAVAFVPRQKSRQLLARLLLHREVQLDVRAVEAVQEDPGLLVEKPADDVGARRLVRRRGEGDHLRAAKQSRGAA